MGTGTRGNALKGPKVFDRRVADAINDLDDGEWFAHTPTYTASGTMTITGTPTTSAGKYRRWGSTVKLVLGFSATTATANGDYIYATLPVAGQTNYNWRAACQVDDGGTGHAGIVVYDVTTPTKIGFRRADYGQWTTGAARAGFVVVEYETA